MNSTPRHIVCIVNGSRPLSQKVDSLLRKLGEETSWTTEIRTTRFAKEAIELAEQAAPHATHILAIGGDGTLHEVVNGMLRAGSKACFGFIPNGTGNDYQRNFGAWNEASWWSAFVADNYLEADLCRVDGPKGVHYALNIAGCGFDGYVVRLLNRQRESWKLKGKTSYATAIVRAFFSYRKPLLRITSEEFEWSGNALMFLACKGSTFGHGLIIAPDARLDSGILHAVLLGKVSLVDYVKNLGKLRKGRRIEHPEAHYFQTKKVRVEVLSGSLCQESDGELGEEGSLEFTVVPAALRVIQSTFV